MSKAIETIVRGVLVRDGHCLLCRGLRHGSTYLPGGHIDPGEAAAAALAREWREELGRPATVGRFLGAVEHAYTRGARPIREINLVFAVNVPGLDGSTAPPSAEAHLAFFWAPLDALRATELEPAVLRACLPAWVNDPASSRFWASTYP